MASPASFSQSFIKAVFPTLDRRRVLRRGAVFFGLLGLSLGIGSYLIVGNMTPIEADREVVWTLLSFNVFAVCGLVMVLTGQGIRLRRRSQRQHAGARLHGRMVGLFATIAVVPAIFVSIFTLMTFDRGLDHWFSQRTKTIINNTTAVANAYLTDQRDSLRRDVTAMAADIEPVRDAMWREPERFHKFLKAQAAIRNMPQALIIDRQGNVLMAASPKTTILTSLPPDEAFIAAAGRPVMLTVMEQGQLQALRLLDEERGLYLYAARILSANVVSQLLQTDAAVRAYSEMENRRFETQMTVVIIYIVLTLVTLLSAVWLGLMLADRLVTPIGRLIAASRRLGEGDLQARVITDHAGGNAEINHLSDTFNEMAERLGAQQSDLLQARDRLNERAQFTEAVLGGISSGVIGVDETGRINHVNQPAMRLTNRAEDALTGTALKDSFPDFDTLAARARSAPGQTVSGQINARNAAMKGFTLRASALAGGDGGLVITFDDVTDLLTAQRSAAWSDIARRIAHEIKNPLTPIQLSAERLQSKFGADYEHQDAAFRQCTETIIRQVEDIGRMVDEFASFARMPTAVMGNFDLADIISQVVLMQRVAAPDVTFDTKLEASLNMQGDGRLISQALINIVKNATEAMREQAGEKRLEIAAHCNAHNVVLTISDTGPGWPDENRYALLEPYNTSRDAGTGLGLSIVKKVIDDHGGKLILKDAPWCADGKTGATVQLEFRLPEKQTVGQSKVLEEL
jgi:two-component system nitrogen regulation sensor histidine kinase NtrY